MKNLPTFTLWCWCKAGRTTLSHRKVRSNDSVSPSSLYHNHHHHCFPSARHKLLSWPISPLCPSQWKYSLGHISIRYTSLMQKCFATSRLQQCNCSNISCFTVCHTVGFIWLHLRIITIKKKHAVHVGFIQNLRNVYHSVGKSSVNNLRALQQWKLSYLLSINAMKRN